MVQRYLPTVFVFALVVAIPVAIYFGMERRKADAELCKIIGGEIIKKRISDIGPTTTFTPDRKVHTGVGVVDDVVRYCKTESGELLSMRELREGIAPS